jgi:3-hydroxypropanoate dehydrogenase
MSDVLAIDGDVQDLLFRSARTANTFTDEPVSDEQVRAIYELVKWAPTSMNIQPLRVVLVRSPEARERLVEHMSEGNKAKTGAAPLVAVLAGDSDFHEHIPHTFPARAAAREQLADAPETRTKMASFNGALQVGYFIVGVRAAGLAAGPMGGFDAEGVAKEFFPGGGHQVLAVVNIGRPGPDAFRTRNPRLDYDQVVSTV